MLKHIEEFEKLVITAGFRNVKIKDIEEFFKRTQKEKPSNVEIQFFDAKFVATWQHLYFAALNALTAFKNQENISKSLAMESLLYASAQRQIQKAIKLLGIKPNSSEIAVLIIGEKPESTRSALSLFSKQVKVKRDDTVLKLSKEKVAVIQKIFGISDIELETVMEKNGLEKALIDLVIERMALLATQH
jgi:KEOPS complex subunit Cgi121